jgi:hypothetical protein
MYEALDSRKIQLKKKVFQETITEKIAGLKLKFTNVYIEQNGTKMAKCKELKNRFINSLLKNDS